MIFLRSGGNILSVGMKCLSYSLAETVEELLDFFGVASVEAWKAQFKRIAVSYRKSPAFTSSKESVSAWLRIGEIEAENIKTSPFDKKHI